MAGRRPLSWLLTPVHVAALATGAKSFCDNPVIGNPHLNRAGLHIARMRLAQRMTEWRRERLAGLVGDEDRAAFHRDGFVIKRDFLPDADYRAVKQQVLAFSAPARRQFQGDAMTRRICLDRRALASLPALRAVVDSPQWLGLVRYVGSFRLEPLVYIQTIFAQARPAHRDPQTDLHADTFHSSVKAWLFLTDVAADQGPFVYVPGSHRMTRRRLAWERRAS
ncbi:MAG TPA: phytanoyl-CoA dioxygenase family protein, partial [Stellaceae bacterium]